MTAHFHSYNCISLMFCIRPSNSIPAKYLYKLAHQLRPTHRKKRRKTAEDGFCGIKKYKETILSDLVDLAHSSLLKSQKVRKFCASALLSPRTAVPFVQHFLSTLRTTSGTLGFNMAFQWSETNNFKFRGALCMNIIIFSIQIYTFI